MSASTTSGPRADRTTEETPQAQRSGQRLLTVLGPFIGLALVIVLFSIPPQVRPTFLSLDNFRAVAAQTVIVGMGALGMTLIIISGGIDLSVGSVLALTSVIVALLLKAHAPPVLAVLAAVLAGGAAGAVNGALITGLRVTPFIVTLGTLGIARGMASWLANEQAVNAPGAWLTGLAATFPQPPWLQVAPGVWIVLALAVVTAVLLRSTVLGRYIVAIGSNETTSRLSGLRVDALKIGIYAIAGLFFGLGGALQFGRLSQGDPTVDVGAELDIIAAVVIGGASLSGGEGSILGSILGALIMSLLRNGSQQMGWPSYVQQIIIGMVIIAAVALDPPAPPRPLEVASAGCPIGNAKRAAGGISRPPPLFLLQQKFPLDRFWTLAYNNVVQQRPVAACSRRPSVCFVLQERPAPSRPVVLASSFSHVSRRCIGWRRESHAPPASARRLLPAPLPHARSSDRLRAAPAGSGDDPTGNSPRPHVRAGLTSAPASAVAADSTAPVRQSALYRQAQQDCRARQYAHAADLLNRLAAMPGLTPDQLAFCREQRDICLRDAGQPVPAPPVPVSIHGPVAPNPAAVPLTPEQADCGPRALALACGRLGIEGADLATLRRPYRDRRWWHLGQRR